MFLLYLCDSLLRVKIGNYNLYIGIHLQHYPNTRYCMSTLVKVHDIRIRMFDHNINFMTAPIYSFNVSILYYCTLCTFK